MSMSRRAAAKLRRGDATRWLSAAVNSRLPGAAPGNIRLSVLGPRRQARVLDAPDLHSQREGALEEVLGAVAPATVLLTPSVARHPRRLALRAQDLPAVLERLASLAPHWEVQQLNRHCLRVRPHFAVGDRALGPIPDLDVMIDVLRRDGDHHVGDALAGIRRVPVAQWETLAMGSLEPRARASSAPEPEMPIDLVYTWVDGSDPLWRQRLQAALARSRGEDAAAPDPHASATDPSRYLNTDELRFSLRSVHRYANWVRRIHIVTDDQVPEWLDPADDRIRIVDHRELLGGSRFNSHAIESALHRIPGLAEHYLYLNDDVFFGRMAYPGDFFAADGVARFFPSDLPIDPGPVSTEDLPIMAAAKNGRDIMARRFGMDVRTKIRHTVHPQLRSVLAQIERENSDAVQRTRAAHFRSPGDISLASSLHHWYAFAQGLSVPTQPNYLYIDLGAPDAGQRLDALESLRRFDTFCLNQEEGAASERTRRDLQSFLERYLAAPAPWERPT